MADAWGASAGLSVCATSAGRARGWASRCVLASGEKARFLSSMRLAHTRPWGCWGPCCWLPEPPCLWPREPRGPLEAASKEPLPRGPSPAPKLLVAVAEAVPGPVAGPSVSSTQLSRSSRRPAEGPDLRRARAPSVCAARPMSTCACGGVGGQRSSPCAAVHQPPCWLHIACDAHRQPCSNRGPVGKGKCKAEVCTAHLHEGQDAGQRFLLPLCHPLGGCASCSQRTVA